MRVIFFDFWRNVRIFIKNFLSLHSNIKDTNKMALPINLEDLLNKNKVESNRIEFKKGWNPDEIFHTICAFATDFEDTGGGYILVGVEQDDNGIAKRPVAGLPIETIDGILKKITDYETKIYPRYITKVSCEVVDGQNILVIWVPAGINRPYSVSERVTVRKSPSKYYIRSKSSTIEAKGDLLDQVRELANKIPFDERGNQVATIDDISPILVYEHLKTVRSELVKNFANRQLIDVLDDMDLITGPSEDRKIKNCAIMMFCEHPERFFPVTQVDIVLFPEGMIENPDLMEEIPKIVGPVPKMIRETLSYLRTNVIKKRISKPSDTEKSDSTYNYPYQAFEEAVVNALYHRNYEEREPVEITIEPNHVEILSHSGPDRSISNEAIKLARRLKTRKYRNRRLGDFLKELGLTEGRATGIPTIQKALRDNGSDAATIDTDDDRSYFLMTIPCRKDFKGIMPEVNNIDNTEIVQELEQLLGQISVQVHGVVNQCVIANKEQLIQILKQMFVQVWDKSKSRPDVTKLSTATIDLLCLLEDKNLSANALNAALEYGATYDLKRKIIAPLTQFGYIAMTNPDKPRSAKQAYKLTALGRELFKLGD